MITVWKDVETEKKDEMNRRGKTRQKIRVWEPEKRTDLADEFPFTRHHCCVIIVDVFGSDWTLHDGDRFQYAGTVSTSNRRLSCLYYLVTENCLESTNQWTDNWSIPLIFLSSANTSTAIWITNAFIHKSYFNQ